jgi:hypothetical protein
MNNVSFPSLVELSRTGDMDALICHLYASTGDCVIASELSESLDLDGVFIIPMKTVRCFSNDFENSTFYEAALTAWQDNDKFEKTVAAFDCAWLKDIARLSTQKTVVAIHTEVDDPDVAFVGFIEGLSSVGLVLRRISSRGLSMNELLDLNFDEITKIEFLTRYLIAVEHAAIKINQGTGNKA